MIYLDCYHCLGSGKCSCLSCNAKCIACAGRALQDEFRPILEAADIDPRERRYWLLHRHVTGAPTRSFIPLDVYLQLKARSV